MVTRIAERYRVNDQFDSGMHGVHSVGRRSRQLHLALMVPANRQVHRADHSALRSGMPRIFARLGRVARPVVPHTPACAMARAATSGVK